MHVLRGFISKLISRRTGRMKTALEWLGHAAPEDPGVSKTSARLGAADLDRIRGLSFLRRLLAAKKRKKKTEVRTSLRKSGEVTDKGSGADGFSPTTI